MQRIDGANYVYYFQPSIDTENVNKSGHGPGRTSRVCCLAAMRFARDYQWQVTGNCRQEKSIQSEGFVRLQNGVVP